MEREALASDPGGGVEPHERGRPGADGGSRDMRGGDWVQYSQSPPDSALVRAHIGGEGSSGAADTLSGNIVEFQLVALREANPPAAYTWSGLGTAEFRSAGLASGGLKVRVRGGDVDSTGGIAVSEEFIVFSPIPLPVLVSGDQRR